MYFDFWANKLQVCTLESLYGVFQSLENGFEKKVQDTKKCLPVVNWLKRLSWSLFKFSGSGYFGQAVKLFQQGFGSGNFFRYLVLLRQESTLRETYRKMYISAYNIR